MKLFMKNRPLFSGDFLKITATVTMLIDHVAASVLLVLLRSGALGGEAREIWTSVYHVMRGIGRTAFPIFAFLLTEGFYHTGNREKYLGRLTVFALLSELPFDLAIYGRINWQKQNIYLTLFCGFFVMWVWEIGKKLIKQGKTDKIMQAVLYVMLLLITAVCCMGAKMWGFDYGMYGILLILLFYLGRGNLLCCILGYLLFRWEPWCIFGFVLIYFYDGTRKKTGAGRKYFFYLFYPVHLLILGLIRVVFLT